MALAPFLFLTGCFLLALPFVFVGDVQAQGGPIAEEIVEMVARQVTQVSQGVYSPEANRTFVVYSGCAGADGAPEDPCPTDPYLIAYDHQAATWSAPLRLGDSPPLHDSHYYPQIVIDRQQRLHVINGGHVDPLLHVRATVPVTHPQLLAPENWITQPFTNTLHQDKATYPLLFKTGAGHLYLFYRQTTSMVPDPWYEPIYYIKSTDDGDTWSLPQKVLDPGGQARADGGCDVTGPDDGWDTVYVKSVYHERATDRLHLLFALHKEHNIYEDKLFYVAFDFADERLYAPTGADLGRCVNQYEAEAPAHHVEVYSAGEHGYRGKLNALGVDPAGRVNIFYNTLEHAGKLSVAHVRWEGAAWAWQRDLLWDAPFDSRPLEVVFHSDHSFDLIYEQRAFTTGERRLAQLYHPNRPGALPLREQLLRVNDDWRRYSGFGFVQNAHPEVQATFVEGRYTYWTMPEPTGTLYAWGVQDERGPFSIAGRVQQANGLPLPGVTVTAAPNTTATTDARGHYTFTALITGTYELTLRASDLVFAPPTRTVTLPPSAVTQTFVGLPAPVSATLALRGTGTLPQRVSFTDTQGLTTSLHIPAGVFSAPTRLELRPALASTPPPAGWADAAHTFEAVVHQTETIRMDVRFGMPVSVSVRYSPADTRLIVDESALTLWRWDGQRWRSAAEVCGGDLAYLPQAGAGLFQGAICRAGLWALFGPTRQVYLPLVARNAEANRLTAYPDDEAQPALAPDGALIYAATRGGAVDLVARSADGGPATKLTHTFFAAEETPVVSPDGARLAFASNRGRGWGIYVQDLATGVISPAVVMSGADALHPSWAPDGRALAFSSDREGNWDIYTATLGSDVWHRLTSHPAADRFPSFSPDGRWLVFRSERDGNSEIYLRHTDGASLRRLTSDPAFDGYPTFTPDGSGVLFTSERAGERRAYVMTMGGAGVRRLSLPGAGMVTAPRLSADGQRIVYAQGDLGARDLYQAPFATPLRQVGALGAETMGLEASAHCDWEGGVLAYGQIAAWEATGDPHYLRWVQQWIAECRIVRTEFNHVNDGLLGYAALVAYETTGDVAYLDFADEVAHYLLEEAPRLPDGTLTHDEGRVWVDTVLGSAPFLLKMGKVRGNDLYTTEAISQVMRHAHYLQDPADGLYRHAWNPDAPDSPLGQAHWARGNGWALLADVAVLSTLSSSHPAYASVAAIMRAQAAGLAPLQDASGRWPTVVDRPDFYLETSGTALIGYGLAGGVQAGVLDAARYGPVVDAALLGGWAQVAADGAVGGVSGPTWPMWTAEYNAIPQDATQLYGQGVMLLLGSVNPCEGCSVWR